MTVRILRDQITDVVDVIMAANFCEGTKVMDMNEPFTAVTKSFGR